MQPSDDEKTLLKIFSLSASDLLIAEPGLFTSHIQKHTIAHRFAFYLEQRFRQLQSHLACTPAGSKDYFVDCGQSIDNKDSTAIPIDIILHDRSSGNSLLVIKLVDTEEEVIGVADDTIEELVQSGECMLGIHILYQFDEDGRFPFVDMSTFRQQHTTAPNQQLLTAIEKMVVNFNKANSRYSHQFQEYNPASDTDYLTDLEIQAYYAQENDRREWYF